MKIIGIDPGTRFLGYSILEAQGTVLTRVECGSFDVSKNKSGYDRLATLDKALRDLMLKERPDHISLEKIFVGKNVDSAFKIGQIRGISVAAACLVSAEIAEYAAKSVKKGITGSGAASKEQVRMLVCSLVGLAKQPSLDASDALALAYHHYQKIQLSQRLKNRLEGH